QKMCNHFDKKEWTVSKRLVDWQDNITLQVVDAFSKELMQAFLGGILDEVWLIYTHFHNIMVRNIVVKKLLPIDMPPPSKEAFSTNYIFEPNVQQVFSAILPRYCLSKLQLALYEANTSELAARILAMRAATKNANEMVTDLTLERNKLRQTGIT